MTPEKSSSRVRWLVLLLSILVVLGPYYSFDTPLGTQAALKDYFDIPAQLSANSTVAMNSTAAAFNLHYNLLYSVYSLPNTVHCHCVLLLLRILTAMLR